MEASSIYEAFCLAIIAFSFVKAIICRIFMAQFAFGITLKSCLHFGVARSKIVRGRPICL